jgi:hypothetical protein
MNTRNILKRFQPITVEEPTVEDTVKILKGLRDKYEAHHKVAITDEAIDAAANLSHRYISDRSKLIGANKTIEEIRDHIKADSLHFLSLESLIKSTDSSAGYCKACLNGDYPMEVPNNGI